MNDVTLFQNARLAFPDFIAEGSLLAEAGRIAALWINEPPAHVPAGAEIIDCRIVGTIEP